VVRSGRAFWPVRSTPTRPSTPTISAVPTRASTPKNRDANLPLVEVVSNFAAQKNTTPAQIALAWLLAKRVWIVPIPGTTKLLRLEENIGAVAADLTANNIVALENVSSKIKIEGPRYPSFHEKLVGRWQGESMKLVVVIPRLIRLAVSQRSVDGVNGDYPRYPQK
jgi:Aldo/keto reductase family